jgi:hypothetical protein
MDRKTITRLALGTALAALPQLAAAQSLDYGSTSGEDVGSAPTTRDGRRAGGGGTGAGRTRPTIVPYIEAQQVMNAELSPGRDVITWSVLAAGVDGGIRGRNSEASFSLRYERQIGWGKASSGDVVSGLVRGNLALVPHAVTLEAGALATRTSIDPSGASLPGSFDRSRSTHLWSAYAGPSVQTMAGDIAVTGSYRFGYTAVGSNQVVTTNGNTATGDLFDHSTQHMASAHAGVRPGEVLPVGLGIGAGYYQEDVANLDQRVKDLQVRADVAVPVTMDLNLVGGVGYQKVEVSSRDAVRDANGLPVIAGNGRYVTDESQPRQIAYESSGLIWDAGVTWRPSRRTALEAHAGWRYGGTTYYGSFGWKPSRRSTLNLSVYDSISGYGGLVNKALTALPADILIQRNPVSNDITGCTTSEEQSGCLTGVFGSLRSATFRARGVQGSYALDLGRYSTGIAAGYDRRKFIAAAGTVLASANGVIDENTWLSAWFGGRIDRATTFNTILTAAWFRSGFVGEGDATALGVGGTVQHTFDNHLSASAALSLQGIQRDLVDDYTNASAQVGLRYSF